LGVARRLADILRVDHAGEYGAVHIYRGQRAVLSRSPQHQALAAQLAEMEAHEQVHLDRFEGIMRASGTRPTALAPLWRIGGFAMGAVTALMGEKAAHACTAAVETVIEGHYAAQIAEIEAVEPELAATLKQFRDDELHHRDLALEGGAAEAPGYGVLSAVIGGICKVAIKVSERV
jgi:ubiquinone biosynthesis monooxygenase Coq7